LLQTCSLVQKIGKHRSPVTSVVGPLTFPFNNRVDECDRE